MSSGEGASSVGKTGSGWWGGECQVGPLHDDDDDDTDMTLEVVWFTAARGIKNFMKHFQTASCTHYSVSDTCGLSTGLLARMGLNTVPSKVQRLLE